MTDAASALRPSDALTPPLISVVMPVYNGAPFIADSVRATLAALDRQERTFELIVVCDGSTDDSAARARAVPDARVRVLHYPLNRGKGHALLHGLEHGRGRLLGWIDSDLDVDPAVIVKAAELFEQEAVDAVVGSKRHRESAVDYPLERRIYSWGFQTLVRLLFRVNVRDTQVGAKLFRREMLDTVAPLLLIKRYAFDLEVLAVGAEFGFDRVREIPIDLAYRFSGTGINWQAVNRMLVDTLAIAYRIHVRHWYVRRFASLQRQRLDLEAAVDSQRDGPPLVAPESSGSAAPS